MASTISNVNQALVDDKVVTALRDLKPMLSAFSYRPEKVGKIQNDSVYVPIGTDPSAQSKTAGTAVTTDGTMAGSQVTLSNLYGAAWDAIEGKMTRSLFESYWADKIVGAVHSLGKQVVDAALALVTATNYSNVEHTDKLTKAIADFSLTSLAQMWEYAVAKIKNQQMSFGMNPAVAGAVFGQSTVANAFAYNGTNFLQTGVVPQLLGMNTWMYSAFPANSENLASAIFGKAAILAATAPVEPLTDGGEGEYTERRIIVDPESGIGCLYSQSAHAGGKVAGECELLYGVLKGQDAVVRHVVA